MKYNTHSGTHFDPTDRLAPPRTTAGFVVTVGLVLVVVVTVLAPVLGATLGLGLLGVGYLGRRASRHQSNSTGPPDRSGPDATELSSMTAD